MSTVPTAQPAETTSAGIRAALPVYAATIGLSAFLLFSVQPLFTKLVLPVLGGTPAVWSVATVVFQCLLLAGYAYAHALSGLRGRTAYLIHLAVLMAAWIALPIKLMPGWTQAPAGWEAPWLAALMVLSIGLPFFAVAANGPLLQAWFARTGHRQSADPYFLYAASNIGSFAALAAYPFLVEPAFRLHEQISAWSVGFGALIALIAITGAMAVLGQPRAPDAANLVLGEPARTSWQTRVIWVGLSAVPSGLLVAVTSHISTDLAPIPLLWIVPLGLYLLTFIVAFRPGTWLDDPRFSLPRVGLTCIALVGVGKAGTLELDLAVHLCLFALTALICHRMVFRLRPAPRALTGFYLALSIGGAIGGLFCGLAAPLLFNTLTEYPLFLIAALACRADLREQSARLLRDGIWATTVCALVLLATLAATRFLPLGNLPLRIALVGLSLLAIVRWRSAATSLATVVGIALLVTWPALTGTSSESLRSFFGVHSILEGGDGRFRVLSHGTTVHGAVRIKQEDGSPATGLPEPTTYYAAGQVIAQTIEATRAARGGQLRRVSAVGLGTGSLACYRKPGEDWTFYEIDRTVVQIAQSRFPFLASCGQGLPVVLGDARLTLETAPREQDLIVVDAFSSDSIPIHLLTREAIGLYLSRLAPGGVVLMHISNRHLDLSRVLARAAAEHGLVTMLGIDRKPEPFEKGMRAPAKVMLLARDQADFGPIAESPSWQRLAPELERRPWTDDFSNVFEALRDGKRPVALPTR